MQSGVMKAQSILKELSAKPGVSSKIEAGLQMRILTGASS